MNMKMYSASSIEIISSSTKTEAAYHRLVLLERSCELYHIRTPTESHYVLCSTENWFHKPWSQFHLLDLLFIAKVTVCDQMLTCQQNTHMRLLFTLLKKNVFIASHSLPFVPAKGLEIMQHATTVNCTCSCGGHSKIIHPCSLCAILVDEVFFFSLALNHLVYLSGQWWCFVFLSIGNVAAEVVPQLSKLHFIFVFNWLYSFVESCFCGVILICARPLCQLVFKNVYCNMFVCASFLEYLFFVDKFCSILIFLHVHHSKLKLALRFYKLCKLIV